MWNKLEKFEEALNKMLAAAGRFLASLWFAAWRKVTPQALLNRISAGQDALARRRESFRAKVGLKTARVKAALSSHRAKLLELPKKLKSKKEESEAEEKPPLKEVAAKKVAGLKSFLLRTPLRNRADAIVKVLQAVLEKLFAIPKAQALIALSAMLMIFFGTYSVYVSSQNIYMKEWGSRAPASGDQYLDRPEYRKFPKRTMKVFNVKIPVYVERIQSVQNVTIDFTVRTDTRFARIFLEEYEYKLKDRFFTTTEPVLPEFPLEAEGKWVLKDKIRRELNNFLRENNVEGEVVEVDIIFIVGS